MLRLFSIEHAFRRIAKAGYHAQKTAQSSAQRGCAIDCSRAVFKRAQAIDGAQCGACGCRNERQPTYSAQCIDTDRWKG